MDAFSKYYIYSLVVGSGVASLTNSFLGGIAGMFLGAALAWFSVKRERERNVNQIYETETVLDDDYPVYLDYWYVCDGVPKRCPLFGMDGDHPTVRDLRRALQCEEVRRCDILKRFPQAVS